MTSTDREPRRESGQSGTRTDRAKRDKIGLWQTEPMERALRLSARS